MLVGFVGMFTKLNHCHYCGIAEARRTYSMSYPEKPRSCVEHSFYFDLFTACYNDVACASGYTSVNVNEHKRDLSEVKLRFLAEGLPFLTVTIPKLAKALDRALASGSRLQIHGFKKRRGSQVPQFLGWLISLVFNDEGYERSDASALALRDLRQLLYLLYKVELPPTAKQQDEAVNVYKQTDEGLRSLSFDSELQEKILSFARVHIKNVLSHCDLKGINPRHGNGAVATHEKLEEKITFKRIYAALDKEYPFWDYNLFNDRHGWDAIDSLLKLEYIEAGTTRVVLVPKDSRGPRVIACEPLEYMWIQQGQMAELVSCIEESPYSKYRVNFRDQEINRRLALQSSVTQRWVTLDMKEASDRVSLTLVRALFPREICELLEATRSPYAELPGGEVITLNKFASMGSCLCFPVEALVFWALATAAITVHKPFLSLYEAGRRVYVYGDDIIARSEDYALLLQCLPLFGLMFNQDKCCTSGSFRESCGCDAYRGVDVTPLRLRKRYSRKPSSTVLESYVAFHNACMDRGMVTTAQLVRESIPVLSRLPAIIHRDSPVLGLWLPNENAQAYNQQRGFRTRFGPYHTLEIYTLRAVSRVERKDTYGWEEMLRITSLAGKPETAPASQDAARAGMYPSPLRTTMKRGWVQCYN